MVEEFQFAVCCRACLTTKVKLINFPDYGFSHIYDSFIGTNENTDDLPPFLCSFCMHMILKYYNFKQKCHENVQLYRELFRNIQIPEDNSINTAESILSQKPIEVLTFTPVESLGFSYITHVDITTDENVCETETNASSNIYVSEYVTADDLFSANEIKKEHSYSENYANSSTNVTVSNHHDVHHNQDDIQDNADDDISLVQIENKIEHSGGQRKKVFRKRKIDSLNQSETKVERESVNKQKSKLNKRVKSSKTGESSADKVLFLEKAGLDENERNAVLFYNRIPRNKLKQEHIKKQSQLLQEFSRKYKVDVKYLTREEQIQEVESRKEYYRNLPFICPMCHIGFYSKDPYDTHMSKHDPTAGDYVCEICGIRTTTHCRKEKHINATHLKRFTCKLCGKVTKEQHYAKEHYAKHGGATYECDQCDKTFTLKSNCFTHIRRAHESKTVNCPICADTLIAQSGLKKHMRVVHKQAVKCDTCNILFDNKDCLRIHLKDASDGVCSPGIRACVRCGEGFQTSEQLTTHIGEQHNKRFSCHECKETFPDTNSLRYHYNELHNEMVQNQLRLRGWKRYGDQPRDKNRTQYMCDQCGKSFTIRTRFTVHMRLHTGEKPYQCLVCAKTFRLPLSLQMHEKIHTDERPYRCELCPAAFRQPSHLRTHHRTHTQEKPHTCTICNKRFSQSTNMRQHVRSVHEGLPIRKKKR